MAKNDTQTALASIAPKAETPLVAPETVTAGTETTPSDKAGLFHSLAVSNAFAATLSDRAEEAKRRSLHLAETQEAIANYYETVTAQSDNSANGLTARDAIETATSRISLAFAHAIQADAMTRQEARRKLGEAFGFKPSNTTGKPTSTPNEPGNTIAKRVSSVTIAVEYVHTGKLPDKGGDSLPLVGQDKLAEILAEYFDGTITVRAASERVEAAIREARTTVPLELNVEKLVSLAGKIQTAFESIAGDEALREAYAVLFETIAAIPFKD